MHLPSTLSVCVLPGIVVISYVSINMVHLCMYTLIAQVQANNSGGSGPWSSRVELFKDEG